MPAKGSTRPAPAEGADAGGGVKEKGSAVPAEAAVVVVVGAGAEKGSEKASEEPAKVWWGFVVGGGEKGEG